METGSEALIVEFTKLYPTYDAKESKSMVKGLYYIYNDKVRNNRIRITDDPSKVGKPCMMTGWVDILSIEPVTNHSTNLIN